MGSTRRTLLFVAILFSPPVFAGAGTGALTIDSITTWADGYVKVFVKEGDRVNGKESCTSVDNSIVLRPASSGVNGDSNIFAQLMKAKITERKISAFVVGCCLDSPCIRTVSILGPIETPQIYTVASAPTTEPAPEPTPEPPQVQVQYVQTTVIQPSSACSNGLTPIGCISSANKSLYFGTTAIDGDKPTGNLVVRLTTKNHDLGYTTNAYYCFGSSQSYTSSNRLAGYVCSDQGASVGYSSRYREIGEIRTGDR